MCCAVFFDITAIFLLPYCEPQTDGKALTNTDYF